MISETSLQKIETLASEVAAREGVKIYDIEFAGGAQGRTLRVYIDKEGGVGVDDCANVSRGLNLLLDVEDPIPGGKYVLEVSSPGLERVLKKPWHFQDAVGKKIWVRTERALESFGLKNAKLKAAKQISEVLLAVENDSMKFQIEGEDLFIPINAASKAKLVFEIVQNTKKNLNPKKGSK